MDETRFDALTKALVAPRTRRRMLGVLGGGALASVVTALADAIGQAKGDGHAHSQGDRNRKPEAVQCKPAGTKCIPRLPKGKKATDKLCRKCCETFRKVNKKVGICCSPTGSRVRAPRSAVWAVAASASPEHYRPAGAPVWRTGGAAPRTGSAVMASRAAAPAVSSRRHRHRHRHHPQSHRRACRLAGTAPWPRSAASRWGTRSSVPLGAAAPSLTSSSLLGIRHGRRPVLCPHEDLDRLWLARACSGWPAFRVTRFPWCAG